MNDFKNTRFGELPVSWRIARIETLIQEKVILSHLDGNHGSDYPRKEEFVTEGVPYISANCISEGQIDFTKAKYLAHDRASALRKGLAHNGDVLFAHNATVGPVALLETTKPLVILSTTLTYYRSNETRLHNRYLKAFLESELFRRQYEPLMGQSTRNQVPITTQRRFYIAVPPLSEQHKIAEILGAWDEEITLTERLTSAKQKYKKGLMQQLLTGKMRFPGFEGEWDKAHLEDCCEILDSRRVPLNAKQRAEMQGNIPYWGANRILDYVNDYIFDEPLILMAEDGGHFYEAAHRPICYLVDGKSWINNHAHVLRVKAGILRKWAYYWYVHRNIVPYINGTTRAKLNQKDLRRLPIKIPCNQEQKEISEILSLCDKEISLLQQKAVALRQQKKGLMQQLLTGKVRVG